MAGNLFQLNHNFLTHKCPNLSTKRHLFKHTEIYGPSEMIAYAPEGYFSDLACSYTVGICKKKMRPDQNALLLTRPLGCILKCCKITPLDIIDKVCAPL